MAGIGFTDEQNQAITTRGCDILVAAAAGSGKTAVLVERIIQMVLDKKKPVDIDKLLVVTFTDAAASEMRQRISNAISKKLEEDPFNEHLQKQIPLLNKSSISTIHSFCLSVIRQSFNLIDIDPSFRIADQTEIALIKRDVMEKLLEDEYNKENNEPFYDLVECYGDKIKDDSLQSLILKIHEFISSSPWPLKWIEKNVQLFKIDDDMNIDDTIWVPLIKEDIKRELIGVLDTLKHAEKICNMPDGPIKYLENIYDDISIVERLLTACEKDFQTLFETFEKATFTRMYTYRKNDDVSENLKEKVKVIRDKEVKSEVLKIKNNIFFKSPTSMLSDLKNLYPILSTLENVVISFSELFKIAKKEKNIVDFNDLEHFCLDVLLTKESDESNIVFSNKAYEFQDKYYEVLIDEYQDSNLVQELILLAVSKSNPSNRFMVGDIKQSIYKFRRSKPELFIEKYKNFSSVFNGVNLKIDLFKNFRSRSTVLDSINFLFYQLMTLEVGDVTYDDKSALYTGANFPENNCNHNISNSTELHLIEQNLQKSEDTDETDNEILELNSVELEAKVIAKRINEMVISDKLYISDKSGSYRATKFSDIVILVRGVSKVAETLIEELKKQGIPAFANTTDGYFNSLEVLTMLAFLQVIDNPRQDIHLLSVLHSPVYALKSQDLLIIRNVNKKATFFDCIKGYLSEEYKNENIVDLNISNILEKFLVDLNTWRDIAVYTPINELLFILYNETDYFNYVGVMAGGLIRQGNLRTLQEKAIQYENTSYKSLFHFIKYIERLQNSNTDMGQAKILSENDNLVKIMTIHKSKGLEFPVVFVSMLGKTFNVTDERKNLILQPELGFGPIYIDIFNRIKSNTIARMALVKKMRQENISEELRVLYVALTRAKEKLILTGTVKKLKENIKSWNRFLQLEPMGIPPYYLLKATSYLDFIVPAICRHRDASSLKSDDDFLDNKNKDLLNHVASFQLKLWNQEDVQMDDIVQVKKSEVLYHNLKKISNTVDYSGFKEEIAKKLSFIYPFEVVKKLPTKVSISEIKRNFHLLSLENSVDNTENMFLPTFDLPNFMKDEVSITSAQKGTIIHTVLEHLDIYEHTTEESINTLFKSLVSKNILSESEILFVPIYKIMKFLKSDLVNRMKNSVAIKRETPFVMGISPYEVYGEDKYIDVREKVLVHGIIDCYFTEKDDNIVLVDYKSDYVTKDNIDEIKEKYKVQLSLYKKAIERSTGKKVKESIIYLFGIDESVII